MCQLDDLVIGGGVGVISLSADVGCFWAEEEEEHELDLEWSSAPSKRCGAHGTHAAEDLEEVEQPKVSQILIDLSADDRRQTRCRVQDKVDDGDSEPSLMDEVHVSDRGDDQGLIRAGGETLDDPAGKEILVRNVGLADGSADDVEQSRDDEDVSFSVFAAEGAYERTRCTSCEKVVAGRFYDGREGAIHCLRNLNVRCVEQRAVRASVQHGAERQGPDDELLLPRRPIERLADDISHDPPNEHDADGHRWGHR